MVNVTAAWRAGAGVGTLLVVANGAVTQSDISGWLQIDYIVTFVLTGP
jgi:hypothetical protein